jgi:hypothetical protein
MRRVLKPGGQLLFVEHGRSSDSRVVAWQDRLTPLWTRISGGCHLNRKVDELITTTGFHITELKNFYLGTASDDVYVSGARSDRVTGGERS